MSERDIHQVFLSSTAEDLLNHRDRVLEALGRLDNVKVIHQERMGARGRSTVEECTRLARSSDIVVVIVAYRYGWIPDAEDGGDGVKSITWLEVEAAAKAGKPVLAFLVDNDYPWPFRKEQDALVDVSDSDADLFRIRSSVRSLNSFRQLLDHYPRDLFSEPWDLAAKVVGAISNEITGGSDGRLSTKSGPVDWRLDIGASADASGTWFTVWAPKADSVDVVLYAEWGDEIVETYALAPDPARPGYFREHFAGVAPGARYKYRLNGHDEFPDPASRYQPLGVHGPSEVVDPSTFAWTDGDWHGLDLRSLVLYQVHVGAATREGTFDALISRLGAIQELDATSLLLMPVADFAGTRNWGYDGVNLFAPAHTYGGPESLRRLVDAAHARGLGVILDVVFNHLGPEGNYLRKFSNSYFSSNYQTPWGDALNFEGRSGRPVRDFFVSNACYWLHEYHIDGLRFDTISAIQDNSELYIVEEIRNRTLATIPLNRSFLTVAEDEFNDGNLVRSHEAGGRALDALYADDFHHEILVAVTNDRSGYYQDYSGTTEDIVRTINSGWFFTGQYSAWRGREIGEPVEDVDAKHFVYCLENHDQVGNRPRADRFGHQVDAATYRAASTLLLGLPFTPLLFMGQEWAASSPFFYFTDFPEDLGSEVAEGRAQLLKRLFPAAEATVESVPQALEAFLRSKLRWEERTRLEHAGILILYRELLALRRHKQHVYSGVRGTWSSRQVDEWAFTVRLNDQSRLDSLLVVASLTGGSQSQQSGALDGLIGDWSHWRCLIDTNDVRFGGPGVDRSAGPHAYDLSQPRALILESMQ